MGRQEENCIAQGGAGMSKSKDVLNKINEYYVGHELYEELGKSPAPAEAQAELVESARKVEEVGGVKTAAAKKNKKKKEKEKERKKAAAAVLVDEKEEATKGKFADKKVSKHILKIQEILAREREAEEKKKREEEEKLRKEEEETLRIEEEERIALQKMREKKDRKKEKKLKDKQEGKPVTRKEKEEARRLESWRNQILANAECFLIAPTKRPTYQTKESRAQGNGSASAEATEHLEEQAKIVVDSVCVEEKYAIGDAIEEKIAEKEEEDVKDWDDDGHKLPDINAFADEENDSQSKNATLSPTKKVNHVHFNQQETYSKKSQTSEPTEESKPEDNTIELRAPVCCVMGHVDSGKTELLDCIRGTKLQEREAGGITQQIGATYIPAENISDRTKGRKNDKKLIVPGLLVIDTPGHESFANLRSRGSSLCDIVVLVVDITDGLQPQTIEALDLLKTRKIKFIVVLNKVDRLYAWKTCSNEPIVKALEKQSKEVMSEFEKRLSDIKMQFMEQGFNTELYHRRVKKGEMEETVSIVPTSAKSGEGIPDLLLLLVKWAEKMTEKLTYSSTIQCTVLEVSVVEGYGTTIDVVLVNGTLNQGDQIIVCGEQGPIVTSIQALLTPLPMNELRVKGTYLHHKLLKAAQAIKISAGGLEHAVAGTSLYVVEPNVREDLKEKVMEDVNSMTSRIDLSDEGVCVHASTYGSLEALCEHLKTVKVPVSAAIKGPVCKKDVIKAGVMLEKKKKEYATILALDVKIQDDAELAAVEHGVKIILGDVIYSLSDECKGHINTLKEEKRKAIAPEAIFPCLLKITPDGVFCRNKSYIILGVEILQGTAKVGTPLCYPKKGYIGIGRIESIHHDSKPLDYAKKVQSVAIKITGEGQKMLGKHFKIGDALVSHITRSSIDMLKTYYRDELSTDDWKLVRDLKKPLNIL